MAGKLATLKWMLATTVPGSLAALTHCVRAIARRPFPQIPTIAVSGEFHPPVAPLGVLADAFLVKPFRFDELLAKVADLLRDAPPRPAIKRDRAPVWVPPQSRVLCNHLHRLPAFLLYTSREKSPTPSRASYTGVHFLRGAGSVHRRPLQFVFQSGQSVLSPSKCS